MACMIYTTNIIPNNFPNNIPIKTYPTRTNTSTPVHIPNNTSIKYKYIFSDLDLKRQMRKIYANANLLLRKFSCCSVRVKWYLFKTYCSTLYCAPMWFDELNRL